MRDSDHDLIIELREKSKHIKELLMDLDSTIEGKVMRINKRIDDIESDNKSNFRTIYHNINGNSAWRNKVIGMAAAGSVILGILANVLVSFIIKNLR